MLDIFVHIGQALQSTGSFFKDMLLLRSFLVAGISIEMIYQFKGKDEPIWSMIIWSSIFILINAYQIVLLANERMRNKLNEKETRLHEIVFPNMAKYNFKKLVGKASWKKVGKDDVIVKEGSFLPELILIYKGLAEVVAGNRIVAMLRDGQFIGEMSFLTGKPTTADVVAATELEYIAWNKKELDELMSKAPDISSELQKIFNSDLIHKLVKQNQEKK
jgi:hypothetical protein